MGAEMFRRYGRTSLLLMPALPAKTGGTGCALIAGSDTPLDLSAATSLLLTTPSMRPYLASLESLRPL